MGVTKVSLWRVKGRLQRRGVARRAHAYGAFRPHKDSVMPIPPEIGMGNEE